MFDVPVRARALLAILTLAAIASSSTVATATGLEPGAQLDRPAPVFARVALPATPEPVASQDRANTAQAESRRDEYIPLPRGSVDEMPPETRPVSAPVADPVAKPTAKPAPKPVYKGVNHVWMPSLGINRTVYSYPCDRAQGPANYVYRWGCAGRNNVYLLGHAWGVFKPLHDAYYNGKLRVGMVVYYADSTGRVRRYHVTTWRVVRPENSSWAIADQAVPSMTLQTCLGANSEYRLNVRLVAF